MRALQITAPMHLQLLLQTASQAGATQLLHIPFPISLQSLAMRPILRHTTDLQQQRLTPWTTAHRVWALNVQWRVVSRLKSDLQAPALPPPAPSASIPTYTLRTILMDEVRDDRELVKTWALCPFDHTQV